MAIQVDQLNIALFYGMEFDTLTAFRKLMSDQVNAIRVEACDLQSSLEQLRMLGQMNIHGVLVGMFDRDGEGVREVVANTRSQYPKILVVSIVPEDTISTGAMLKATYEQLDVPILVNSLLIEIARFVD